MHILLVISLILTSTSLAHSQQKSHIDTWASHILTEKDKTDKATVKQKDWKLWKPSIYVSSDVGIKFKTINAIKVVIDPKLNSQTVEIRNENGEVMARRVGNIN